jgi:hypothetical protein
LTFDEATFETGGVEGGLNWLMTTTLHHIVKAPIKQFIRKNRENKLIAS